MVNKRGTGTIVSLCFYFLFYDGVGKLNVKATAIGETFVLRIQDI